MSALCVVAGDRALFHLLIISCQSDYFTQLSHPSRCCKNETDAVLSSWTELARPHANNDTIQQI